TSTFRINDSDPIAASVALSRSRWATRPKDGFLSDGPLWWAAEVKLVDTSDPSAAVTALQSPAGPVLFVHGNSLDPRVKAEIRRLMDRRYGTVILVGRVSSGVAAAVASMGFRVQRKTSAPRTPVGGSPGETRVLVVSDRDTVALANYGLAEDATSTW